MPAIEIRPAIETDIPVLTKIDHSFITDHVWQVDMQMDEGQLGVRFREMRLPRPVRVDYPRLPKELAADWASRPGLLVATLDGEAVGYTNLVKGRAPLTAWMTDLVVAPRLRRRGIGSALLLAALEWTGAQADCRRLIIDTQHKNIPAINLVYKFGFDFCGYTDHYYANQDVALFFAKWV
jgi:ribosomal protein S18 acetylase RimI-like enzyme